MAQKTQVDRTPPTIVACHAQKDSLLIAFSEPLRSEDAENLKNYQLESPAGKLVNLTNASAKSQTVPAKIDDKQFRAFFDAELMHIASETEQVRSIKIPERKVMAAINAALVRMEFEGKPDEKKCIKLQEDIQKILEGKAYAKYVEPNRIVTIPELPPPPGPGFAVGELIIGFTGKPLHLVSIEKLKLQPGASFKLTVGKVRDLAGNALVTDGKANVVKGKVKTGNWETGKLKKGSGNMKRVEIRGVYSHPGPFWQKGAKLNEYGVNAVFVHSGSINDELIERCKAEGCKVFAEFATLNGKVDNWVEKHPEAHPINEKGEKAPPATWFMGVCPTNKEFREFRMNALRELLRKYDLAGVWMDYLHWHAQFEDPYPVFPKTCFNDSCLEAFQQWAKVKVPEGTTAEKAEWIFRNAPKQWEDWRCSVITDWASEIRRIVKEMRPNALLGNYQCPWRDDELGVVRRCLGLDFDQLAKVVDVFSPMVYHGRCGRTPEWVGEYVGWFSERVPIQTEPGKFPKLFPIVQAHDEPPISPAEFEKVLRLGLSGKATGVMMFTIGSVAQSEGKMEAMKRVYLEVARQGS